MIGAIYGKGTVIPMKKFISLLVAFAITINFICVQVAAEDETESGKYADVYGNNIFEWEFRNGSLSVSPYGSNIPMPDFESPDDVPWAHLRERITDIEVGRSFTSIGQYAFYGCTSLTTLPRLPSGTGSKVGKYAFAGCTALTSVQVSTLTNYIDDYAFEGCTGLTEASAWGITGLELGNGLFKDCTSLTTVSFPMGNATEGTISAMGEGMFENCISLSSVTIENINEIGINTFKNCVSLTSAPINKQTTSIGAGAFSGCANLTGVKLYDSITSIGTSAFENCTSLEEIVIPTGVEEIGEYMFYGDSALKSVTFHDAITTIGDSAFYGCSSLANPEFPASVTEIGNSAFYACSSFTEVILPAGVVTVGDFAFNGCENLKAVFVPASANIMGSNMVPFDSAFQVKYELNYDETGIEIVSIEGGGSGKVDIPASIYGVPVVSVEMADWDKVSQNHSHYIVGGTCTICGQSGGISGDTSWSVTTDGTNTLVISEDTSNTDESGRMADYTDSDLPEWYDSRNDIEKLLIRDGVTYIGNYAFYELEIENIVIPSSVTAIGNNAFNGVTLTDTVVWIPESVNAVGEKLFEGSNVTMILYPASLSADHALPENAVKAKYIDDGDTIRITDVDDKVFLENGGTYTFPSQWNGKPVIAGTHNHQFKGEYGHCTVCNEVIGGNIGKVDEEDVYWYWSEENATVFVLAKEGVSDPAIKDFTARANIYPDTKADNEGSNPWYKLQTETKTEITKLSLSNKITEIGNYAFQGLTKITDVTIPASTVRIGDHAFEDCRSLAEAVIPDGVTEIGANAFFNCLNLGRMQLPESVTTVGTSAFMGCEKLNQIAYPDTLSSMLPSDGTIPDETFKLEYAPAGDNKVTITKIIPGAPNALVTVPETICGKEVISVQKNYYDLVNKDTCPHKYIDPDTNVCLICGNVQGDASEELDKTVEWKFVDPVLYIWGNGKMQNFTNTENPPWQSHLAKIKKIVISDGVRSIGSYAFDGAQNLSEVEIPNSVTEIGHHAFAHCVNLKDIVIPTTVTVLGNDIFYGYSDIVKVTIPHDLYNNYKDIIFTSGNTTKAIMLFYKNHDIVGASLVGEYTGGRVQLPDGFVLAENHEHCFKPKDNRCILCDRIGGFCGPNAMWSFDELNGILEITGYGEVTENPWITLYKDKISRVSIADDITSLCNNAFSSCKNLSEVSLGVNSKMTAIGESAFSGCTNIRSINLPGNLRRIGDKAFENTGLSGVIGIPIPVESIGNEAFSGCDGITVLAVHQKFAESNSSQLSQLVLPDNGVILAYDGECVVGFFVPDGATHTNVTVTVPGTIMGNTIVSIENTIVNQERRNTDKIVEIVLPESVRLIKKNAFSKFTSLRQVNIPAGVTLIEEAAFSETALEYVTIPSGVDEIPKRAFESCSNLKTVRLPDGLHAIREGAFASCNVLEELTIPDTVTIIEKIAFTGCQKLKKLIIPYGVIDVMDSTTFAGCTGLEVLEIPERIFSSALEQTLSPSRTTVIKYELIDDVFQITGAVLGKEERWDNDNLIRYPVWENHADCFNSKRRCVLCGRQGGKCGDTATWIYKDNEYTIVISGTGTMWDMEPGDPHYEEMWFTLKPIVQKIEINSGLESIGANVFADCPELNTVTVPGTVKTIGRNAFGNSPKLDTVSIEEGSVLSTIGDEAFNDCISLENISLPRSLTSIGSKAFMGCTGLKGITIPNGVTYIGSQAFSNCTRLANAKLPVSLSTFGNEAFTNCTSLTEIVVPVGATSGTDIFKGSDKIVYAVIPQSFNESNFTSPQITVVKYNAENNVARITDAHTTLPRETIVIPAEIMDNTVRVISRNAFTVNSAYDKENTSVQLPETLTTIDDYAFEGCTWLKEINIPGASEVSGGVTYIGKQAFEGCTTLTEVVIPDSVTTLGKEAFQMCTNLKNVTLSDSMKSVEESTFNGCSKLAYIVIPEGVIEIEEKAFEDCAALKYAVLPFSMRNGVINFTAFDGCTSLAALFTPTADGVKDDDGDADDVEAAVSEQDARKYKLRIAVYNNNKEVFKVFDGTTSDPRSTLEEVLQMPEGFTLRLDPPHKECFNIHNQCILCGDRGGYCGVNAQWKLDSAGNLTIWGKGDIDHDNPEYYGTWDNFRSSILRLEIGEGITSVDDDAFRSCRLISAKLPGTLEEIGSYAFSDCIALTAIEIPNSVINIGEGAFEGDLTLRSAVLPNSISRLNSNTFKDCISLATVKLPEDLRYVETGVFSGCTSLTMIELPINTTRVSEEAFKDCVNLTYIVAPDRCNYTFNGDEFVNATYFKYAAVSGSDGVKITYARPGRNIHELIVPREIAGRPVVAIGDNAFAPEYSNYAATYADDGETGLVSVTLPVTVTAVGDGAFKNRTDIRRIIFEGRVETIGNSAFENCTALEEAALPDSVKSIGNRAFYNCMSLRTIPLYEGLEKIGSQAFEGCNFDRSVIIVPSTVEEMGEKAFGSVSNTAVIAISEELAKNYDYSKDNCGYLVYRVKDDGTKSVMKAKLGEGMITITVPGNMTVDPLHEPCWINSAHSYCALCDFAGGSCGGDETVDGNNAFWRIDRETGTLYITGTGELKDYLGDETAPWLAPELRNFIKAIEIGSGITSVSSNAFLNCENVKTAVIPSTVNKIGENSFLGCDSLTEIVIPEGVTNIRESTFKGCASLKNVKLPDSLSDISSEAFKGCTSLSFIELGDSDVLIASDAFDSTLDYIAAGNNAKISRGKYNVFRYEPAQNGVKIVKAELGGNRSELKFPNQIGGKTVVAIGGDVVNGYTDGIKQVTLQEGVETIEGNAFKGCTDLTYLTLPKSLKTIGNAAFTDCISLTPLNLNNGLQTIGENAFTNCDSLIKVKLPYTVTEVGNGAFSDCDKLETVIASEKTVINRNYFPSATLVSYNEANRIIRASLGNGRSTIDKNGMEVDPEHEHCWYQGVCLLCNDSGGLCGSGLLWSLNDGVLVIERREGLGATDQDTGEMYDFGSSTPTPWGDRAEEIRKLVIREGAASIGANAFRDCTALTDISEAFPSTVTVIGENAFRGCLGLRGELTLAENITVVGANAFADCPGLTEIILSDKTGDLNVSPNTAVIKYHFEGSGAVITKIVPVEGKKTDIPDEILGHKVVKVEKAYRKYVSDKHNHYHTEEDGHRCTLCDRISGECGPDTSWYIDEENKRLIIEGQGAMYDYDDADAPWTQYAEIIDNIIIRDGVTSIGDNAFVNCGSFDEITLPQSIVSIGDNAFAGCSVRRMYIPSHISQADRDKLSRDIEKVFYTVGEYENGEQYADVTRIDLPEGVETIVLPKTINCIPVRQVYSDFRKYVSQDGHEHKYHSDEDTDSCHSSECLICGKVTYVHVWEDTWSGDENSHWHDCKRGDYSPIRDGNIDGSGYGDHDWKEVERKEATKSEDGYVLYRCEVCGREKSEVLKWQNPDDPTPPGSGDDPTPPGSGDNPNPPGSGDNPTPPGSGDNPDPPGPGTGSFEPPPSSGGTTNPPVTGGSTVNPPSPGNSGGNTTTPPQTQPWEEITAPPVTNPPSGNNVPNESEFKGNYNLSTEQANNALNASIADNTSQLLAAVLTQEERDNLVNGNSNVQIILSVTEGDGTVSLRDRAIISAALGEYRLGEYLDISLYKVIDGVRERITHTNSPITITIDIPGSLRNSSRRFRMIRAHEGVATVLRDMDNNAGTITIATDRFSPYAIAYTDSVSVSENYDPPMNTGDTGISAFVLVTMASGLTAVGMIYFNHASDVVVEQERRKKIAKLIAFGKKGKLRKYVAIPLIFLVTLYYQGIEGIQKNKKDAADEA